MTAPGNHGMSASFPKNRNETWCVVAYAQGRVFRGLEGEVLRDIWDWGRERFIVTSLMKGESSMLPRKSSPWQLQSAPVSRKRLQRLSTMTPLHFKVGSSKASARVQMCLHDVMKPPL